MRALLLTMVLGLAVASARAADDAQRVEPGKAAAAKEKELTQREAALAAREKALSAREQALATREQTTPAKEKVAFLGVSTTPAADELRSHLKLPKGVGLVVAEVTPDSPAAKVGLAKDDVLLKLDEQLLVVPEQLAVLVHLRHEGDKVRLTVVRHGKEVVHEATLASRELEAPRPAEWPWREELKEFNPLHLRRFLAPDQQGRAEDDGEAGERLGFSWLPGTGGVTIEPLAPPGRPDASGARVITGPEIQPWIERYLAGLPAADRPRWEKHFQGVLEQGKKDGWQNSHVIVTPLGPIFVHSETEELTAPPAAPAAPPAGGQTL